MNAIVKAASKTKAMVIKHAPEILTGCAITAGVAATGLAITGTIKAVRIVDAKKEELGVDSLGFKETAKAVWPCYVPVVAALGVSVGCSVASTKTSIGRTAAYATYSAAKQYELEELKKTVKEVMGEKKAAEIEQKAVEKQMSDNPPTEQNVYVVSGGGETLFYDSMNDRYFKSTWEAVMDARHRIIDTLQRDIEETVTLNDCYYELGVKGVPYGDYRGFKHQQFTKEGLLEIFKPVPHEGPNHQPCFAIKWKAEPIDLIKSTRYDTYY